MNDVNQPTGPTEMRCAQVSPHLSDLLDARRGATVPNDLPVADVKLRQALEMHLKNCSVCLTELNELEQVGYIFAEFSVGEKPTQDFANYGARCRQRMNSSAIEMTRDSNVIRPAATWWKSALVMTGASAAAAALMVAVLLPGEVKKTVKQNLPAPVRIAALPPSYPEMNAGPSKPPKSVANMKSDLNSNTPQIFGIQPVDTSSVPTSPDAKQVTIEQILKKLDAQGKIKDALDEELAKKGALLFYESPMEVNGAPKYLLGISVIARSLHPDEPETTAKAESDSALKKPTLSIAPKGLLIKKVFDGSPAERAKSMDGFGLLNGDVILAINDLRFTQSSPAEILKLFNALEALGKGEEVIIEYARRDENTGLWVSRLCVPKLGDY